ncbi:hypothetical protein QTP70_001391 [Hemibagrus guttatus]|uniref:Uncharacterized protein n=1 Tax=Hemibagrus guttatus TaxID=175788 RepID=A0AAE0UTL0_9TELE|nr:hypothetical protein QTP70_001391 [Hemibagrus guttatus]
MFSYCDSAASGIIPQAMRREGKDVDIKELMDGWTLQMGYPVVTISTNESPENTVTISQEHFLYDTDAKIHHRQLLNKSLQWRIPLKLALGNFSHISTESLIWISNKTAKSHHLAAAPLENPALKFTEVPAEQVPSRVSREPSPRDCPLTVPKSRLFCMTADCEPGTETTKADSDQTQGSASELYFTLLKICGSLEMLNASLV